jgi:hypothetical protein
MFERPETEAGASPSLPASPAGQRTLPHRRRVLAMWTVIGAVFAILLGIAIIWAFIKTVNPCACGTPITPPPATIALVEGLR